MHPLRHRVSNTSKSASDTSPQKPAYARSSVVRESFDSRGDDYASRGGNPRYSNENVEVRPRARRRPRAGEPRAPRASRDDLAEDLFRVLSDTSPVSEASPPLPRGPPSFSESSPDNRPARSRGDPLL